MTFGQAIVSGIRGYVNFRGRASRAEYWYWTLLYWIALTAVYLSAIIATAAAGGERDAVNGFVGLIYLATLAGFASPSIAVAFRRMHDLNKSGWWSFISLTVIGVVPLLIWYCTRGTIGENRFGPDPLAAPEVQSGTICCWSS